MYTDGEITLNTLAIELDSLLYSKHGEYALDKMSIVLDPLYACVNNTIYGNANIDTLAYK